MRNVLVLSIGPVQDFIRAARKTRDLWYGSQLLSNIARAAAEAVHGDGAELIFPFDLNDTSAAPNKIVALTLDGSDPEKIAQKARAAAQDHLELQAQQALNKVRLKAGQGVVHELAYWAQIRSFLEFYAAWSPVENAGYVVARQKAERLLAGRKALRDFRQPEQAVGRPKSSLDGGREIVLNEAHKAKWSKLQIKQGEQLDAISLVKRLAEVKRFVSVARVAADPWLRQAKIAGELNALCAEAERYTSGDDPSVNRFDRTDFPQYADFPYDTQLFYDSEGLNPDQSSIPFRQTMRLLNPRQPTPYLCLLAADGDRMGKIITGLETADKHRELSAALGRFAQSVEKIVRIHGGALIYAGGDDVMAFVPLDRGISCAHALQVSFAETLQDLSKDASLSIGLAIAHFLTPLDQMLEWARNAERAAKTMRSALAVSLHTRTAGSDCITVVEGWKTEPMEKWNTALKALLSDSLPDGLAYKLKRLADEFEDIVETDIQDVLILEIERIVKHSRRGVGSEKIEPKMQKALVSEMGSSVQDLRAAVNRLIIARHLERAGPTSVQDPLDVEVAE